MLDTDKAQGSEGNQDEGSGDAQEESTIVAELKKQVAELESKVGKVQSVKDKEADDERKAREASEQEVAELRSQMAELITDPEAKKNFQLKAMQTQLEKYRQRDEAATKLRQTKEYYAGMFDISVDNFSGADSPEQVVTKVAELVKASKESTKVPPKEEEDSVADSVISSGASVSSAQLSRATYEKELAALLKERDSGKDVSREYLILRGKYNRVL